MAIFHHQSIDTRQISCSSCNPQIVNNDADASLQAAIIGDILSVFMIVFISIDYGSVWEGFDGTR
jgi:hypothetical protein